MDPRLKEALWAGDVFKTEANMDHCAACGNKRYENDLETCGCCGFRWCEIRAAECVVDAVGKAFGVDTGTIQEEKFRAAMAAVLAWIAKP